MRIRMGLPVLMVVLLVATAAGPALAQQGRGERHDSQRRDGGDRMSGEERRQLREDLQRQHNPGGAQRGGEEREGRYAEWQRHTPEQREAIRRDLRNANRNLDRPRR